MRAYCIDLDSRRPEVLEFDGEELAFDMEFFGAAEPTELTDADRKVFNTAAEAEAYLARYNEALRRLRTACKSRDYPGMLYKRRYLVQTLLGDKASTERHYRRDWKPGQLFNFHDQVYFVTVELIRIQELRDESGIFYKYDYRLPRALAAVT